MSTKRKKAKRSKKDQLCLRVTVNDNNNNNNYFGYAWFKLHLSVSPVLTPNTTIDEQPINAKLLYDNGEVVDVENTLFVTEPKELHLNQFGHCSFQVKIDTYSMFHSNRQFKIAFQCSQTATRHIIPTEMTTFRLVKHRLEVVEQPSEKFYKDEGGRANCLHCKIVLKDSQRNTVQNRDISLRTKLVYCPELSVAQSSRDILEILTQKVQLKNGVCDVEFRINEVSKNHNKRAFCVLFECQKNDPLSNDISSCHTRPIMVYSKRTKPKSKKRKIRKRSTRTRKRAKDSPSVSSDDYSSENENGNVKQTNSNHKRRKRTEKSEFVSPKHKRAKYDKYHLDANTMATSVNITPQGPPALAELLPTVVSQGRCGLPYNPPPNSIGGLNARKNIAFKRETNNKTGVLGMMFDWCKLAEVVLRRLEWTKCGYEYNEATSEIDISRPLYRCAYCLRYKNQNGWGSHHDWCQLQQALVEYANKIKPTAREYENQLTAQPIGSMNILEHNQCAPPSMPTIITNHNHSPAMDEQKKNDNITFTYSTNMFPTQSPIRFPSATMMFQTPMLYNSQLVANHIQNLNSNSNLNKTLNSNNTSVNTLKNSQQTTPNPNLEMPPLTRPLVEQNSKHKSESNSKTVKTDDSELNGDSHKNCNGGVILPPIMHRVTSVARERSKHGFAAFDDNQSLLGFFNTTDDHDLQFFDVEQFKDDLSCGAVNANLFSDINSIIMRRQSDDVDWFQELQNNIG